MKNGKVFLTLLLAAALLAGCAAPQSAPAEESAAPAPETVVVSDVPGLLSALAPGALIEIDAENQRVKVIVPMLR